MPLRESLEYEESEEVYENGFYTPAAHRDFTEDHYPINRLEYLRDAAVERAWVSVPEEGSAEDGEVTMTIELLTNRVRLWLLALR